MFVKPATRPPVDDDGTVIAGAPEVPLSVRHPTGHFVRPDGEEVPEIDYFHRLVRDGDLVLAERREPEQPIEGEAP